MSPLFIDTRFLIALETFDDQHHAEAAEYWQRLAPSRPHLVTTSFVLDEVVTFFNSRNRHTKAVEIANRLLSSPSVNVLFVDEELFRTAVDYLTQRADKRYSLTDCVSFVVMERLRIGGALAFDAHFEQAGFTRNPALPLRG
ncbi:MAG TPA: PIN domain-containing protein [Longimicrobiaceae bacterium]|nr:PIN domain-containing protein [Longimicrobiaceae bacterium]